MIEINIATNSQTKNIRLNIMKGISSALLASALLIGYTPITLASDDTDTQNRINAAKAATNDFVKRLGGTLKSEMKKNGPESAITVCRDIAPKIAGDISLKNGWQVTRVSSKPRNTMLGLPDSWEQTVLRDFEKRRANGEKLKTMYFAEVVKEPEGESLRYMKAIGTAPVCLSCHGNSEQISETVQAKINSLYPHDKATGYKAGELRGAVSIKQPLPGNN